MKPIKTFLNIAVGTFILTCHSCKDAIDDIIPQENPYNESIAWNGYYNHNKSQPFSGSFNEVSFKFDKEADGKTYAVIIENTNLTQLSLQLLSIKLNDISVGTYNLNEAFGSLLHYKDFNKKAENTSIKNGTLTLTNSVNKDEITGSFNGWGLSGNDTLYLTGNFNRKKK